MTGPSPALKLSRRAVLTGGVALGAALLVGCADTADKKGQASSGASSLPAATPSVTATTTTTVPGDTTSTMLAEGLAEFVVRGPADSHAVALTFHTNGDLDLAQALLDVLVSHDAVATSFIIGEWLEANPAWATKLAEAGLELANHTYTHPSFGSLSPAQMTDEIGRCRDVLLDLTGEPGRLFRPSGTSDGTAAPADAILAASVDAGYPTVLGWDVEPFDYQDPGATTVQERVLAGVSGGSIVSMHFGHPGTVAALDPILTALDQRGLRTVTASDLLAAG